MGIRAHLQKGRTKPGLVLPADAAARVNQYQNQSTTEKWLGDGAKPTPNIQKVEADPSKATLHSSPVDNGPDQTKLDVEAQDRANEGELQHAANEAEANKQLDLDDMTEIDGVGGLLETKLYGSGYKTYKDLAGADKAALAEISGVSDDMAKEIVKQAKKLARAKAAKAKAQE